MYWPDEIDSILYQPQPEDWKGERDAESDLISATKNYFRYGIMAIIS